MKFSNSWIFWIVIHLNHSNWSYIFEFIKNKNRVNNPYKTILGLDPERTHIFYGPELWNMVQDFQKRFLKLKPIEVSVRFFGLPIVLNCRIDF